MINNYSKTDVVEFAYQVIEMDQRIRSLESELTHYKKLHEMNTESQNASIEHGRRMMGNVLTILLDRAVPSKRPR